MLVVNLESTHKSVKPPRNYPNYPQITQTTHKPSTNQPKPAQTIQTTHKPSTNQPIYPQTSQTTHKPATNNQLYQKIHSVTMQNMCYFWNYFTLLNYRLVAKIKAELELTESDAILFKR